MEPDRLVRREADLSKAGPPKLALALQVALVVALPESKAGHGILWEEAVVARRSIRTQAVSGFSVRAQLLRVPVGQAGAARAAEPA